MQTKPSDTPVYPGGAGGMAAEGTPFPTQSRRYLRYSLAIFTTVSTLNFVDRQLLSILVEPIKAEFRLSDTELGFLTGFAFAIFYTLVGFPLARLADRGNRRSLVAAVVSLWSVMTALCGLATGFWTLLLARIGVGVGEAGSNPAVQSMLADQYAPRARSSAIAIQSTGIYFGILIGFLSGGWISQYFGWRAAFVAIGAPGILLGLLIRLTIKEPRRGCYDDVSVSAAPSIREALRSLLSMQSYRYIPVAMAFYAFATYGSMAWAPAFFMRVHEMGAAEVGTWLALTAGLAGGLGCYFGGVGSDYLVRRTGDPRWLLRLPCLCILLSVPMLFGVYLSAEPLPALLMSAMVWFLSNTWLGPVQATIVSLAGPHRRAIAITFVLFVNNLVGLGLGPQVVGILSDALQPGFGAASLRYALLWPLVVATLLSGIIFFRASNTLQEDLENPAA